MKFSRFLQFYRLPILVFSLLLSLLVILPAQCDDAGGSAQTAINWTALAGNTLLTLLQVVGAAIATLLGAAMLWLCKSLAAKFNIQMSAEQDAQVYAAADKAVAFAEEWARKQSFTPIGSEKADMALSALREVLDSKTYAEFGEPALRKLVDGAVAKMRSEQAALPPATPTPV
jgi:hypothetical protein